MKPDYQIQPAGFTQIPGSAAFVAASPDGSLWALGTLGIGPDKFIYHYVNGTWSNVPGLAVRLAVGPNGIAWALNSAGGIFYYYNGKWNALAGGASEISISADGSVYVISNQYGGPLGNAIYHFANGAWTQVPGSGSHIAASWDTGTYLGGMIVPNGFYITNASGSMYYYNPYVGFAQLPGGAELVAPTASGGLYALGNVTSSIGSSIYYNNLESGVWTQEPGAGVALSTDGRTIYIVGAAGGIYRAPVTLANNGSPLSGQPYGPSGAWGPPSVAGALGFPVQSGYDGSGETVAIIMDNAVLQTDLQQYLGYFQTPLTNSRIELKSVDNAPLTPRGDATEATLDLETVAGLAQGANIIVYVVPDLTDMSLMDAVEQIESDGSAKIITYSASGCESSDSPVVSQVLQAAAQRQIAFIAAAGDSGSACYAGTNASGQTLYSAGVGYPASDPSAIGVGGSETYSPFSLTSATVWNDNDSGSGNQEAGGGGVSRYFAIPSYQVGLPGLASTQNRNVPDVAMPAVYDSVYYNGQWEIVNGTSWGAPMFAAMFAEVYEYCSTAFTNAAALPYAAYRNAGYGAFLDVDSGNNGFALSGVSTPTYFATSGYDNASGLGVPLGLPFAQAICPNRIPSSLARRAKSASARTVATTSHSRIVNVMSGVRDIVDRGRRPTYQRTKFQLVLQAGPAIAANEEAVKSVLHIAGFTIVKTFRNHLVVDAEGTSSGVERLFSTTMHTVTQGRFGSRYVPLTNATMPQSLAPYVAGVILDNVVSMASSPSHTREVVPSWRRR